MKATKKALERHHLFPKAWLEKHGVDDQRSRNQMANYALVEWPDNIDISDKAPADYVPELQTRFAAELKNSGRGYPRPLLRLRLCATPPLSLWLQLDENRGHVRDKGGQRADLGLLGVSRAG